LIYFTTDNQYIKFHLKPLSLVTDFLIRFLRLCKFDRRNKSYTLNTTIMKSSVICILLVSVIWSCSPTFYMPNTQNIPLHTAKGQTNVLGSANGDMVDLQLSHSLGDNFGIM